MPVIPAEDLISWTARLFEAAQICAPKARLIADALVAANLRGVDSHGVQLLPLYIDQIERGDMDAHADGHVVSESGGCLVFDGENGIGQHTANVCCRHAMRLAKAHGLSMVVAREANHFGAAAYWAQQISQAGAIGIVMCNASPLVAPWQGKQPRLGTNPICMSVPGPWLLDMATTTVAMNRIFKAFVNREPAIPAGWAMDSDGVPTTNTDVAIKGMPMPLGGYKGTGLGMLVEILCGVIGGGAMGTEVGGLRIQGRPVRASLTFLAVDVGHFMPVEEFSRRVQWLVDTVKSAEPATSYDEVMVAGDPEWRTQTERRRHGIPLGEGTWKTLVETAEKLGIAVPAVRAQI